MERLDSRPVIRIFLPARNPMAVLVDGSVAVAATAAGSPLLAVTLDDAAGEPVVDHAKFGFGIGIQLAMNDHRMPDDVVRRSGSHRQARHLGFECRVFFM